MSVLSNMKSHASVGCVCMCERVVKVRFGFVIRGLIPDGIGRPQRTQSAAGCTRGKACCSWASEPVMGPM